VAVTTGTVSSLVSTGSVRPSDDTSFSSRNGRAWRGGRHGARAGTYSSPTTWRPLTVRTPGTWLTLPGRPDWGAQ
jgi:hypothetical protein